MGITLCECCGEPIDWSGDMIGTKPVSVGGAKYCSRRCMERSLSHAEPSTVPAKWDVSDSAEPVPLDAWADSMTR